MLFHNLLSLFRSLLNGVILNFFFQMEKIHTQNYVAHLFWVSFGMQNNLACRSQPRHSLGGGLIPDQSFHWSFLTGPSMGQAGVASHLPTWLGERGRVCCGLGELQATYLASGEGGAGHPTT